MAAVMVMAAVGCEKGNEKENSVRVLYLETSVIGAFEYNFSNDELADVITPLITYDIADIVNNYEPEPVEGIPTIESPYPIQKYIDANDLLTELFKTKYPCLNRAVICLDYLPEANEEEQNEYADAVAEAVAERSLEKIAKLAHNREPNRAISFRVTWVNDKGQPGAQTME